MNEEIVKLKKEISKIKDHLHKIYGKIRLIRHEQKYTMQQTANLNPQEKQLFVLLCEKLTKTEKKVFNLVILDRHTSREASNQLHCSVVNIRKHLVNIYAKIDIPEIRNKKNVYKRYEIINLCQYFPHL